MYYNFEAVIVQRIWILIFKKIVSSNLFYRLLFFHMTEKSKILNFLQKCRQFWNGFEYLIMVEM